MIPRKTKIICSIGPVSDNDETIQKLISAGMNIARFNFSHGNHEWHRNAMDRVRRISRNMGIPVGILLDTKGPEIRTGLVKDDKDISIKEGDTVEIVCDDSFCYESYENNPTHLTLSWKELPSKVYKGVKILLADGLIELEVRTLDKEKVFCIAKNSGSIGSRKNVNLIGIHAGLPIMSEQDKKDIAFGVTQNVDFIAASFVSFEEEVVQIRHYLDSLDSKIQIIAKIENEEALDNIDAIIEKSDGIMVARGDLGVQVPTERIPLIQKSVIGKCRKFGKPVITATQMLDSMIVNPRPTRAELTDVANAIFDGTDAIMLSGETAGGKYPVEAVQTMDKIARTTENSSEYCQRIHEINHTYELSPEIGHILTRDAQKIAARIKASAIITPTLSGNTACMISQFHPEQIIIAVTTKEDIQRKLLLRWGVYPVLSKVVNDSETMIQNAVKKALATGIVKLSDRVVMAAGIPLGSPLMVNTIRVILVGTLLTRGNRFGFSGEKSSVCGKIIHVTNAQEALMHIKDSSDAILVCNHLTEDYIPVLRLVKGIIVKEESDLDSEIISQINNNLVWVIQTPSVQQKLEQGLSVTIDGEHGLIYEGVL